MTTYPEPMKITSPTLHATILFTISVFVAILAMSFLFKFEVVARGEGRIVPISRVQVVQPEFAGRIVAIHVRNGMTVDEGNILVELDLRTGSDQWRARQVGDRTGPARGNGANLGSGSR